MCIFQNSSYFAQHAVRYTRDDQHIFHLAPALLPILRARPTSTSSTFHSSEINPCHDPQQASIGFLADVRTFTSYEPKVLAENVVLRVKPLFFHRPRKTSTCDSAESIKLLPSHLPTNGILPAPSAIKREERKFVEDSGASMHMSSTKDLNSAELETVKVSRNPTKVVTANGEVQTKEEAIVHVRELDLFVTVMLLEDTLAVLSLKKLCEDHRYSYHWTSGQKPQLTQNGRRKKCNTANYVPIVVPGLSTGSSSSATPTSSHISTAGSSDSYIASRINKK